MIAQSLCNCVPVWYKVSQKMDVKCEYDMCFSLSYFARKHCKNIIRILTRLTLRCISWILLTSQLLYDLCRWFYLSKSTENLYAKYLYGFSGGVFKCPEDDKPIDYAKVSHYTLFIVCSLISNIFMFTNYLPCFFKVVNKSSPLFMYKNV